LVNKREIAKYIRGRLSHIRVIAKLQVNEVTGKCITAVHYFLGKVIHETIA